ncbi:MAG TPA: hypothetical protein VJP77_04005 [Planctomycetota bacterium]|nr:hypothetical protein [Planctomycetota bacterium]
MPRELPALLLDRSVGGERARRALTELGFQVVLEYELTGADRHHDPTPDEVWLRLAGERGLVIVTADKRIMRRRLEREALVAAGTWVIVLTLRDQTHEHLVRAFGRHRAAIERAVLETDPPAAWRLNAGGLTRVEL